MIETSSLYWRLTHNSELNSADVSLLMPAQDQYQKIEEIPTNLNLEPLTKHLQPIDIKWSEEDRSLFCELLLRVEEDENNEMVLDLTEDYLQEIIHWVAIKRFSSPVCLTAFEGDILQTERVELEVGDIVAIHTLYGFNLGLIVALNSIDADCILLDAVCDGEKEVVRENTLVNVSRLNLLAAEFAEEDSVFQVLH